MKNLAFLSLFLFISTSSLYFLSSGGPQLCDVFLVVLIPSSLYLWYKRRGSSPGLERHSKRLSLVFFIFVFWIISINLFYYLQEGDISLVRNSIQWVYSTTLFFACLTVFVSLTAMERVALTTLGLSGAFILIPFVNGATELVESDLIYGRRQTFSFNNPNQLAYFCVLAASICLMNLNALGRQLSKMALLNVSLILAANVLVLASASRSAILSIVICDLILLAYFSRFHVARNLRGLFLYGISGLLLTGVAVMDFGVSEFKIYERFEGLDVIEDLSYRVADRYSQYANSTPRVLFGSGKTGSKGEVLAKLKDYKEVHNSFIDIAASYGLLGLFLFVALALAMIKYKTERNPGTVVIQELVFLAPTAAYMLTHQGLRFRLFWVLLALWVATRVFRSSSAGRAYNPNVRLGEPRRV